MKEFQANQNCVHEVILDENTATFFQAHGQPVFKYMKKNPEYVQILQGMMNAQSQDQLADLLDSYLVSRFRVSLLPNVPLLPKLEESHSVGLPRIACADQLATLNRESWHTAMAGSHFPDRQSPLLTLLTITSSLNLKKDGRPERELAKRIVVLDSRLLLRIKL